MVRRRRTLFLLGSAVVAGIVGLVATPSPGQASNIVVSTASDDAVSNGNCSLREAILAANTDTAVDACTAGNGADAITVPAGTYTLSVLGANEDAAATGDLDITANLTINGSGALTTIIDGNGSDRVFHVDPGGTGIAVGMSGLTIRNGSVGDSGGGVFNAGTLTLSDAAIADNDAGWENPFEDDVAGGGGIYNEGTLTVTDATLSGNTVTGGLMELVRGGGAIDNNGSATITNATIDGNAAGEGDIFYRGDGGGIRNRSSLTLSGSTLTNNVAFWGGGIRNEGTLTVSNSSISTNDAIAGGGVDNIEFATLSDVTVDGNEVEQDGGGIGNARRDSGKPLGGGSMTLVGVTISNNAAMTGGGSISIGRGGLSLTNGTVSGNTGGGIIIGEYSALTMLSSTVTGNAGGPAILFHNALVTVGNTIVANNLNGDCQGTVSSTGYNLIKNPAGCTIIGDTTGNIIGADPLLGPLADNGGATHTHELLPGSPAIDAGPPACPPPATDQRGVARPQDGDADGGATCDIGAFEREGPVLPTATPTPSPTPTPHPGTPTPTPECIGDVNGDGRVTGADVATVARNLSRQDGRADVDGDGRVTLADLRLVIAAQRSGTC